MHFCGGVVIATVSDTIEHWQGEPSKCDRLNHVRQSPNSNCPENSFPEEMKEQTSCWDMKKAVNSWYLFTETLLERYFLNLPIYFTECYANLSKLTSVTNSGMKQLWNVLLCS